jgi:hypothetical protein
MWKMFSAHLAEYFLIQSTVLSFAEQEFGCEDHGPLSTFSGWVVFWDYFKEQFVRVFVSSV